MPLPPYHLLLHWNPDWFNLSGAGLPRLSWKRDRYMGVCFFLFLPSDMMLAWYMPSSCIYLSVYLSVTSWCSTKTAELTVTQTMPHDSPGTLVFRRRRSRQNSNSVTHYGGTKCRWGRLKLATFTSNYHTRLKSVTSLSHWASTFVYSTFTVMQSIARVRQQQLVLVSFLFCTCRRSFVSRH